MIENLGGPCNCMGTNAFCTIDVQIPGMRLEDEQKLEGKNSYITLVHPFSDPIYLAAAMDPNTGL
jgi:hypothetical protein